MKRYHHLGDDFKAFLMTCNAGELLLMLHAIHTEMTLRGLAGSLFLGSACDALSDHLTKVFASRPPRRR